MKRELPSQFVLSKHVGILMLPFVAFFPLVITIAVFIGMTLTNSTSLDEWQVPLLGIGGMSLFAFLIGILFEVGLRWWTMRLIKRVYDEAWVVWLKYSNVEQWQRFVEKEHERDLGNTHFELVPIIIVGIVVLVIGGAAIVNNAELSILFALGGFMVVVIGIVGGRWLTDKWSIDARYKRRKNAPIPAILISPYGHYDEDLGFDSLRRLQSVNLKLSPKKHSAKLNFVVKAHWLERISGEYQSEYYDWRVSVGVPKGYQEEAEALVTRFNIESLR